MQGFSITSSYTLTENTTATIHSLMAAPAEGSSDLATLSKDNYTTAGSKEPNAANQLVFMNQPLSWWNTNLNAGTIKYMPVSNHVNWGYVDASGNVFHISTTVTNAIIPNRTKSASSVPGGKSNSIVFESKFGLHRTDVHKM